MPMRHKYLIVVSLDEKQISDIKRLFLGRFKILVSQTKQGLDFLHENEDDIAGVVIDDSLEAKDVIDFLSVCFDEGIYERVPTFLLYDGLNNNLYIESIRLGIDEVIRKPYEGDILQRRIYHIIELFNQKYRLEWLVDTQTKELQESIQVLEDMKMQVLEALGTLVEFRNMESGEHIYRVRFVTDILMRELQVRYPHYGITNEIVTVTDMASILHDIGKIMISDMILNKPSKLTNREFEEMKLHTYYGCQILEKLEGLYNEYTYRFYKDVICYHHEKYDGNGYPEGLKGNEIPIWAQIVSLADVYDALTNERVYKKAYTHQEAKDMIFNGECGVFNPDILDCFEQAEKRIIKTTVIDNKKRKYFTEELGNEKRATILTDYEKERAFHRAYQELVSDYFFEYDVEYGIVKYFNAFGKDREEKYILENIPGLNKSDETRLKDAIGNSSPNDPVIHMRVAIYEKGKERLCELTLRTTWDMYTGACIGGVGKLEFIE